MTSAPETGGLTLTTPTDTEIVVTRFVAAPRELVFATYTEPAHLQQWMLGPDGWTMPVCESDTRPGGAWRYVWRDGDGNELAMTGTWLEVEPPARLVSTESWGEGFPETVNTVELTDVEGGTLITTTVVHPNLESRDAALASGMTKGMAATFARLDEYLAGIAG